MTKRILSFIAMVAVVFSVLTPTLLLGYDGIFYEASVMAAEETDPTEQAGVPQGQDDCDAQKNSTFFGLPTWYKFLPYKYEQIRVEGEVTQAVQVCRIQINLTKRPEQLALIGFAIIDILLRLGGLLAVGFVIYGGVTYIISQGEPDKASAAKSTILNAIIGLGVAIVASGVVAFIAGRLT